MTAVEEVRRPPVGERLPRRAGPAAPEGPGAAGAPAIEPGRSRRYRTVRLRPTRTPRRAGAHSADDRRRRLVREQLVVVAVLAAALAVTLALLGMQWLDAGAGSSTSAAAAAPAAAPPAVTPAGVAPAAVAHAAVAPPAGAPTFPLEA